MHELNIREMTQEQLAEESLIDLAYAILQEKKTAVTFYDLLEEIKQLNGLSDENAKEVLVQFFTELNIDGRFLLNRDNTWGLREWYKIETIEEETAPTVKTRKRRKALLDDEEELIDEDDLVFEEDFEEFIDDEEEDEVLDDEDIDFVDDDLDAELEDVEDDLLDGDEEFLMDDDDDDDELIEEEEE